MSEVCVCETCECKYTAGLMGETMLSEQRLIVTQTFCDHPPQIPAASAAFTMLRFIESDKMSK